MDKYLHLNKCPRFERWSAASIVQVMTGNPRLSACDRAAQWKLGRVWSLQVTCWLINLKNIGVPGIPAGLL